MDTRTTRRTFLANASALPLLLAACGGAAATATIAPAKATTAPPTVVPLLATPTPAAAAASTAVPRPTSAAAAPTIQPAQSQAAAVPSCVLTTQLTEGPYFVDEKLERPDVRSDPSDNSVKQGVPLTLTVRVLGVSGNTCAPIKGAQVDIWHRDALGVYSDAQDPGFNTKGKKFLRGYQVTDDQGMVKFTTIYPGWYQGRATHVHFKIRHEGWDVTSQWFFDEALNDQVYSSQAPYSTKGANGRLKNSGDDIFRQSGGTLTLNLTKSGDGYAASFDAGVKLT